MSAGRDTAATTSAHARSNGAASRDSQGIRAVARRKGSQPSHPALSGFTEKQIAAAREAVLERVRRSFRPSLSEEDVEDAAQEAWAALLERQGDAPVEDLAAFVSEVGWRSARGVTRRPRPVSLDPEDSALLEREDLGSSPLDRVARRAAIARVIEAVEQLSPLEREAFRLWFVDELEAVDAAKQLGISRSAYFKRLTGAKARVEGAFTLDDHRFTRAQRRLLSDYVAGIAEGRARMRAEKLIAADPQAAAMAREIRRAHEAGAVVLPAALISQSGDPVPAVASLIERVRDAVSGVLGRAPDPSDVAGAPAVLTGGARGAGAVGAGALTKVFGGLGAGGVAAGCVGGGALVTVACVATGLVSLPGQGPDGPAPEPRARVERVAKPAPSAARSPAGGHHAVEAVRAEPESSEAVEPRRDAERSQEPRAPEPEPTLEPTTPPEVQEFGVAAAGTPVGGAPPDTDDSNGAAASTVRQEFGP